MHRTVPMPDMEEVDLYLRKSKRIRTEDPRDLLSVQTQEELGRAWAAKNGKRVREVWVDNLSAWSDVKLPEFDKAVAAVLAGDVPILWCAFLDRFTRKGRTRSCPSSARPGSSSTTKAWTARLSATGGGSSTGLSKRESSRSV
ncbi:hypothetical protein ACFQ0M_41265 [Kitasatospora aburaviensis]